MERSSLPLIVTGSDNPVTERQIDFLIRCKRAHIYSLRRQSLAVIKALTGKRRLVVLRVPVHQLPDERLLSKLTGLDGLLRQQAISSLILIGGDTARLVVRWLRAKAITLCGEIAPGIPWGRFVGGKAAGMTVCTKAGGFGGTEALMHAVDFLVRTLQIG